MDRQKKSSQMEIVTRYTRKIRPMKPFSMQRSQEVYEAMRRQVQANLRRDASAAALPRQWYPTTAVCEGQVVYSNDGLVHFVGRGYELPPLQPGAVVEPIPYLDANGCEHRADSLVLGDYTNAVIAGICSDPTKSRWADASWSLVAFIISGDVQKLYGGVFALVGHVPRELFEVTEVAKQEVDKPTKENP